MNTKKGIRNTQRCAKEDEEEKNNVGGDRSISSQLTENKRAKEGLRILLSRLNDCSTTFRDRDEV